MNAKCDGSTWNSKTLQIQTICSAVSVYLSTFDPAMEVLKICKGWFECACLMLLCTKRPVKSSKAQAFSLLQTALTKVMCIFPSLLEHLSDVGTHQHPPYLTVQYSSLSSPVLSNQSWSTHVILIFSVTKQQSHETNTTESWNKGTVKKQTFVQFCVSYFWCFSPAVPHKQPHPHCYFWFPALSNVKIIFKSINTTRWIHQVSAHLALPNVTHVFSWFVHLWTKKY